MDALSMRFVSMARQEVDGCLATLRSRAAMGTRAKPTVAELNNMLLSLENAAKFLQSVEAGDTKHHAG